MQSTIAGVDLAKNVIQVCLIKNNKVISNEELTSEQFMI
jgi:transposase